MVCPGMCLLCDQARGQQFQASECRDGRALYGLSIAPVELLDSGSVAFTRGETATDEVLDYYLHTSGGSVTISGGGFGDQIIQSQAIPGSDQNFFNDMVRRLDNIIDLDFRQINNSVNSAVDIYYDTEIDLGSAGTTLGLATTSGQGGWELFLNYPQLQNDENYRRYVLLHEFGHSLGLEHPFENRDGDVFNGITDPWNSAFPEDTVMAYRTPRGGIWPEFFTDNDLNALIKVWGGEARYLTEGDDNVVGNSFRDILLGDSGNDHLRGLKKNDLLNGGTGEDRLLGGPGADQLYGGAGNDTIHGGWGHDEVRPGSGNDLVRGGYGSDLFVIGSGNDVIEDFRISDNDQIGMRPSMQYGLFQDGNNLNIVTDIGTTILYEVDLYSFSQESFIVTI